MSELSDGLKFGMGVGWEGPKWSGVWGAGGVRRVRVGLVEVSSTSISELHIHSDVKTPLARPPSRGCSSLVFNPRCSISNSLAFQVGSLHFGSVHRSDPRAGMV